MIGDYERWLTAAEDDEDTIAAGVVEFVRWHAHATCGERRGAGRCDALVGDDTTLVYATYRARCAERDAPIATAAVFARIFDRLSGPRWWDRR